MTVASDPIPDTAFLGEKINEMCDGKDIYWMYPGNDTKPSMYLDPNQDMVNYISLQYNSQLCVKYFPYVFQAR